MYYPFIRGKQFELLMLRELASKISEWGFVPIIEPVKENFPALKRALDALKENNCRFVVVANPSVGDLKEDKSSLWNEIFDVQLAGYDNYSVGLNMTTNESLQTAKDFFEKHHIPIAVIHGGFTDGKELSGLIKTIAPNITEHIFIDPYSSMLYRRHFKDAKKVLIKDGFISRTNKEYPPSEPFSDLYLTYSEMGCEAFGDFLMVGSDYKEGGGPAYAIAIHLTYADPAADNAILIRHYVSDQINTPKDPAGKFLEALRKLETNVQSEGSLIFKTDAVNEYLQYYKDKHFPGLGYAKKLSMQHHMELMAHLLKSEV